MLYQLSYASPFHPETVPEAKKNRTGTLSACTHYGTKIKVSIPAFSAQFTPLLLRNHAWELRR